MEFLFSKDPCVSFWCMRKKTEIYFLLKYFLIFLFLSPVLRAEPVKIKNIIIPSDVKIADWLPQTIKDRKVIYIGENHDKYNHHQKQLEIITFLIQQKADFAVGMEMFSRSYQHMINDYLSDKITEEVFLLGTRYFEEWGYDYNLYKDIIEICKKNRVPLIGLNLKNSIVKNVNSSGAGVLSLDDLSLLPDEIDFGDENYRTHLQTIFENHPGFSNNDYENFYFSQLLWDETMAETVSDYLKKNPMKKMVVLAGAGHIENASGIPERVNRRMKNSYVTFLLDAPPGENRADYYIYTRDADIPRSPKLGVMIKVEEGKLKVIGFYSEEIEKNHMLKKDDLVLAIEGKAVESVAEIRYILYKKKPGDFIKITIIRGEEQMILNYQL